MTQQQDQIFRCRLRRIEDSTYLTLFEQSWSIHTQLPTSFAYYRRYGDKSVCNFARYYAAMRLFFGQRGQAYDDWKGTFAFPFELEISKGEQIFRYLAKLVNFRTDVELSFQKLVDHQCSRLEAGVLRAPFDEEFSAREMRVLDNYLLGMARGIGKYLPRFEIPEFVECVESNGVIYGHLDGVYFEKYYQQPEMFDQSLHRYRQRLSCPAPELWPEPLIDGWLVIELEVDNH